MHKKNGQNIGEAVPTNSQVCHVRSPSVSLDISPLQCNDSGVVFNACSPSESDKGIMSSNDNPIKVTAASSSDSS